jgi:putative serine protease PepD
MTTPTPPPPQGPHDPTQPLPYRPPAQYPGAYGPPPGQPYGSAPAAPYGPPPGPPYGQPLGQQQGPGTDPRQPRRAPRRAGWLVAAALLAGVGGGVGGAAAYDHSTAVTPTASPGVVNSPASAPVAPAANSSSATVESVARAVLPSVVQINEISPQGEASGSGIILSPDGVILTNNHVVEMAANQGRLVVSFNDGTHAPATIIGRDPLTDLAVIKAAGVSGLTPAKLGSSLSLAVGQQVLAIGSPFGLESTVTEGIVSALNRPVSTQPEQPGQLPTVFPAIQTDAAINPGNSGGPLVDMAGRVVGIDSAIRTTSTSPMSQGGSIGLGFAIPIDEARPIIQQLRKGETPTHAKIGIEVRDAVSHDGLTVGARVMSIEPNSAAAKTALRPGDIITGIGTTPVTSSDGLVASVRSYRPGDTVQLTVMSHGQQRTVTVTLGSD